MRTDNILIQYVLDIKQVAIYSAANSLAFAFPLITSSIMKVLMREISKNSELYLKKLLFYQKKYFGLAILAIAFVWIVSPYLIPFMFGEKYIPSILIFQILSIVYIGGIFFTPLESYYYTEDANIILKLRIIQLLLTVVLGVLFMRLISLPGLVIAVVVTRIVAWIYLSVKSYKMTV
jgi:PST family polysaccharide transporter